MFQFFLSLLQSISVYFRPACSSAHRADMNCVFDWQFVLHLDLDHPNPNRNDSNVNHQMMPLDMDPYLRRSRWM